LFQGSSQITKPQSSDGSSSEDESEEITPVKEDKGKQKVSTPSAAGEEDSKESESSSGSSSEVQVTSVTTRVIATPKAKPSKAKPPKEPVSSQVSTRSHNLRSSQKMEVSLPKTPKSLRAPPPAKAASPRKGKSSTKLVLRRSSLEELVPAFEAREFQEVVSNFETPPVRFSFSYPLLSFYADSLTLAFFHVH